MNGSHIHRGAMVNSENELKMAQESQQSLHFISKLVAGEIK